MQHQIQNDIRMLEEDNRRLREQIEENEKRIRSLQAMLPDEPRPLPPRLIEGTDAWGLGNPPVPGAIPARTMRDETGQIRILLCRMYAGEGWKYTPVADGWIVVTNENYQ